MEELIKNLKLRETLRSQPIEDAMRAIDRANFIPKELKRFAYSDEALPIGNGQTISQPSTVVFMLELLKLQKGNRVLEIGYGSGWQTALLSHCIGEKGRVYAAEIVPELCTFGQENVSHYKTLARTAFMFCENVDGGFPNIATDIGGFDRIICAARVQSVPSAWRAQLKVGGIMVYPAHGSIFKEAKTGENAFSHEEFPGYAFVPYIPPRQ